MKRQSFLHNSLSSVKVCCK